MHGVTTVIGGNCGFTIAPLAPEHGDYLMRMLARVEGMPIGALQEGVPVELAHVRRVPRPHRRHAGTERGLPRRALDDSPRRDGRARDEGNRDPEDLDTMRALLDASLAAGGLGFSSCWARTHNDAAGDMVPSRYATEDEIIALCQVVREHPGTTLEFIPCVGLFEDYAADLMTRMSLAANRPVNWNVLFVGKGSEAMTEHNLAASDYATAHGARVLALTMPFAPSPRICFDNGFLLDTIPGWEKPMALPHDEKKAMLASADGRNVLREAAEQPSTGLKSSNWGIYVINETFAPENKQCEGKPVSATSRRSRATSRSTRSATSSLPTTS